MTNLPVTSIEAYKSITPEMLLSHHGKILLALKELGSGMYEEIAVKTGLERHSVARRLKELQYFSPQPLIYNTGEKRKTSTGRNAFVYKLVENN